MLGQILYKKTKPNLSQSYLTQGKHLSWFEEVKDLLRLRISKDLFSFWHWVRSATLATRSMLLGAGVYNTLEIPRQGQEMVVG